MKPNPLIDTFSFNKEILKEKESIKNSLASGACSSYDDYCHMVGVYEGLEKVQMLLEDLNSKYSIEDD